MLTLIQKFKLFVLSIVTFMFVVNVTAQENLDPTDLKLWSPPNFQNQFALGYEIHPFVIPKAIEKEVQFWIDIYTKYTTFQGVYHKVGDITVQYGKVDLTDIYLNPQWGPVRKELEGKRIIELQRKNLAKKLNVPIKSIRLQMGLRDRMAVAIKTSGYYMPMIEQLLEKNNLPKELSRLIFVESSFNTFAESKVGAAGLWQIMPNIGQKLKLIKNDYDLRLHPYYATLAAIKILKQNFIILNNWPLAVTSYNFGVGSMMKVQKKLKKTVEKKDLSNTEIVFNEIKNKKLLGFASSNFYATFLAALYVESHANLYFGDPLFIQASLDMKNVTLSKKIKIADLLKNSNLSLDQFKVYNPHLKKYSRNLNGELKPGAVVFTPKVVQTTKVSSVDSQFE